MCSGACGARVRGVCITAVASCLVCSSGCAVVHVVLESEVSVWQLLLDVPHVAVDVKWCILNFKYGAADYSLRNYKGGMMCGNFGDGGGPKVVPDALSHFPPEKNHINMATVYGMSLASKVEYGSSLVVTAI